jgi:hypothetical protein
MKVTPYAVSSSRAKKSPFRSPQKVKEALRKYKKGEKIGFTGVSSLKSMGLIPRSHGKYELGKKYL